MEEARGRFVEAAQIVVKALAEPEFEFAGEFFQIPRIAIRPRPISQPQRRFFASAVSPESAEIMARLGFGLLMIMQNEWQKAAEDIARFREIAQSLGHAPPPPIVLTNVSCAPNRSQAEDRAFRWLGAKWQSIDDHYHFSDGHLAGVKGYEAYGKVAKTYAKMKDPAAQRKATEFYVKIQIVGTPADCLEQIRELQRLTGLDHLITEFSFGGMPHAEAEANMRLFAERVLPTLQKSDAAAGRAKRPRTSGQSGIFAPA